MSFRNRFLCAVFFMVSGAFPFAVRAQQTDTTTFNVLIEIVESCDISTVTATDVDFGSHVRNNDAPVDAEGTLTVNCTDGTDYTIGLNEGLNSTGTTASADNRQMTDGTNFVPYGLYQDATRTQFWGDVIGTDTLAGTGTATDVEVPVYGRALSTDYPPGSYIDTVTATITY